MPYTQAQQGTQTAKRRALDAEQERKRQEEIRRRRMGGGGGKLVSGGRLSDITSTQPTGPYSQADQDAAIARTKELREQAKTPYTQEAQDAAIAQTQAKKAAAGPYTQADQDAAIAKTKAKEAQVFRTEVDPTTGQPIQFRTPAEHSAWKLEQERKKPGTFTKPKEEPVDFTQTAYDEPTENLLQFEANKLAGELGIGATEAMNMLKQNLGEARGKTGAYGGAMAAFQADVAGRAAGAYGELAERGLELKLENVEKAKQDMKAQIDEAVRLGDVETANRLSKQFEQTFGIPAIDYTGKLEKTVADREADDNAWNEYDMAVDADDTAKAKLAWESLKARGLVSGEMPDFTKGDRMQNYEALMNLGLETENISLYTWGFNGWAKEKGLVGENGQPLQISPEEAEQMMNEEPDDIVNDYKERLSKYFTFIDGYKLTGDMGDTVEGPDGQTFSLTEVAELWATADQAGGRPPRLPGFDDDEWEQVASFFGFDPGVEPGKKGDPAGVIEVGDVKTTDEILDAAVTSGVIDAKAKDEYKGVLDRVDSFTDQSTGTVYQKQPDGTWKATKIGVPKTPLKPPKTGAAGVDFTAANVPDFSGQTNGDIFRYVQDNVTDTAASGIWSLRQTPEDALREFAPGSGEDALDQATYNSMLAAGHVLRARSLSDKGHLIDLKDKTRTFKNAQGKDVKMTVKRDPKWSNTLLAGHSGIVLGTKEALSEYAVIFTVGDEQIAFDVDDGVGIDQFVSDQLGTPAKK